ncbi:MAG: hypothetical protein SVM80_04090 [Halobacteriota archaeon]|nr:hypothetical protein [Halobacteriota archaeon]
MYAQELMKEIIEGLTTLFSSIISGIATVGAEDYPAVKAGNMIGGLISAVVGLLGPLINSVMNLVPGIMGLGDRAVTLTMDDATVNSAYHSVHVAENLPKLMGNSSAGMGYLLNATTSIGLDGTSYTGDPQVGVNFMEGLYLLLAELLEVMGNFMVNTLPSMFPWG